MNQNSYGGVIYALRKSRSLTQEQLAEQLSVSSVTISKWERGETAPSLELLCKLADYFKVTVDELLGRNKKAARNQYPYSETKISDYELGLKLLKYCELSRREGYLALEPAIQKDKPDAFLEFSISFVLDCLQKDMSPEQISRYLKNYAAAEPEMARCNMIADVLLAILSGENPEVLKELIASWLGKELRNKFMRKEEEQFKTREAVLQEYIRKKCVVDLLEELDTAEDAVLRTAIRNLDNLTLAVALSGASGKICIRFLKNLSDRLLYFLDEDIRQVQAGEGEIREAQRKVLALVRTEE